MSYKIIFSDSKEKEILIKWLDTYIPSLAGPSKTWKRDRPISIELTENEFLAIEDLANGEINKLDCYSDQELENISLFADMHLLEKDSSEFILTERYYQEIEDKYFKDRNITEYIFNLKDIEINENDTKVNLPGILQNIESKNSSKISSSGGLINKNPDFGNVFKKLLSGYYMRGTTKVIIKRQIEIVRNNQEEEEEDIPRIRRPRVNAEEDIRRPRANVITGNDLQDRLRDMLIERELFPEIEDFDHIIRNIKRRLVRNGRREDIIRAVNEANAEGYNISVEDELLEIEDVVSDSENEDENSENEDSENENEDDFRRGRSPIRRERSPPMRRGSPVRTRSPIRGGRDSPPLERSPSPPVRRGRDSPPLERSLSPPVRRRSPSPAGSWSPVRRGSPAGRSPRSSSPAIKPELIFEEFDWSHVIVAGGYVLSKITNDSFVSSDIDMFLYGMTQEEAIDKIKYITEFFKVDISFVGGGDITKIFRTNKTITLVGGRQLLDGGVGMNERPVIQIILHIYESPIDVISSFDLDCIKCYYDGTDVMLTGLCYLALSYRYNLVDMTSLSGRKIFLNRQYEERLIKYQGRGFEIRIPGFDWGDVKSRIFKEKIENAKGLELLLRKLLQNMKTFVPKISKEDIYEIPSKNLPKIYHKFIPSSYEQYVEEITGTKPENNGDEEQEYSSDREIYTKGYHLNPVDFYVKSQHFIYGDTFEEIQDTEDWWTKNLDALGMARGRRSLENLRPQVSRRIEFVESIDEFYQEKMSPEEWMGDVFRRDLC